jgi:hypothetical protein
VHQYADLEAYDDELESAICLRQVRQLAQCLGVSIPELVTGARLSGEPVPLAALPELVRSAMSRDGLSIDAFEEKVGWELREFLASPQEVAENLPLMFLHDVATGVGIDYVRTLPVVGQHAA